MHAQHTLVLTIIPGLLVGQAAYGTELGYSYLDFSVLNAWADDEGRQSPVPNQFVDITSDQGDGLAVTGALAVGARSYILAGYRSAVVDVDAVVTSPQGATAANGNFDFVATQAALGYLIWVTPTWDAFAELTYDRVTYDFGSFAGESFDIRDSGIGLRAGVRWNPRPAWELALSAQASEVGQVDLSASQFRSDLVVVAAARYQFFQDLAVGVEIQSGLLDALVLSLRFGFGGLRVGSD